MNIFEATRSLQSWMDILRSQGESLIQKGCDDCVCWYWVSSCLLAPILSEAGVLAQTGESHVAQMIVQCNVTDTFQSWLEVCLVMHSIFGSC